MSANGRHYDWEDISVTLPGGEAVGITEIKYSDEQSIEAREDLRFLESLTYYESSSCHPEESSTKDPCLYWAFRRIRTKGMDSSLCSE